MKLAFVKLFWEILIKIYTTAWSTKILQISKSTKSLSQISKNIKSVSNTKSKTCNLHLCRKIKN